MSYTPSDTNEWRDTSKLMRFWFMSPIILLVAPIELVPLLVFKTQSYTAHAVSVVIIALAIWLPHKGFTFKTARDRLRMRLAGSRRPNRPLIRKSRKIDHEYFQ